jgi:hypothetical protein
MIRRSNAIFPEGFLQQDDFWFEFKNEVKFDIKFRLFQFFVVLVPVSVAVRFFLQVFDEGIV